MERDTQQRQAIRDCLAEARRPLSPQEVLAEAMAACPRLGIATVYRTIKSLVGAGEIVAVDVPGEPQRYEMAGLSHHHHFHCRKCDKIFDVPGCGLHVPAVKLARGFRVEEHEVWLIGLCDHCTEGKVS